jgi:hypothetical protein
MVSMNSCQSTADTLMCLLLEGRWRKVSLSKGSMVASRCVGQLRRLARKLLMPLRRYRWLVDKAIKLESKYDYPVCRNTCGVVWCLDC